jgi:hypothetical protein
MRNTIFAWTAAAAGASLLATPGDAQVRPIERPAITSATAMQPGEAPAGLTMAAVGPRAVRLSWTAPAGATGYVVSRAATAAGPWTPLTASPITATDYLDNTVSPKSSYAYRVAARYSDKLDGSAAPASVATPCDKYCVIGDCAPKPAAKLTVAEGSVGSGRQWRLTLKVAAQDAASGAALNGTVTVNNVTGALGSTITYPPCRQGGRTNDQLAEIVACRARVTVPGRLTTTIITGR